MRAAIDPSSHRSIHRFSRWSVSSLAALAVCGFASNAFAQDEARDDDESSAYEANKGLGIGLGPMFLIPVRNTEADDEDALGGGADLDIRYGIPAGPVIISPGVRGAGYYLDESFIGLGMGTGRLTLPVGPLAPYGIGGIGGGGVTKEDEGGLALMAGGGLMLHFGRFFGLGAEATYQTITETDFKAVSIGPLFQIGI